LHHLKIAAGAVHTFKLLFIFPARTASCRGDYVKKYALALVMLLSATAVFAANINSDLAEVRQATAKYHNVQNALDDNYVPTPACVEVPGLGVMGIHYVNFGLIDGTLDPTQPENLLYVPTKNGLRLVGVEYMIPSALASSTPRP
jgi:hypothetical protein